MSTDDLPEGDDLSEGEVVISIWKRGMVHTRLLVLAVAVATGFGNGPVRAETVRPEQATGETVRPGQSHDFDIPAQPMPAALAAFVAVTAWQLDYDAGLVAGMTSAEVSGRMTAGEALDRLLAGSGLDVTLAAPGGATPGVATPRVATPRVATLVRPGPSGPVTLPPMIVTAQRIGEDERKVPVSMEVVTAQEIRDKGLRRLSDLAPLLPNASVQQDGSGYFATPIVRGIGNEIPFTDPSVSVFVDGAPMPGGLSSFDLQDVERVEVLRGPQSTLFGQNTVAGAINIVTRRPVHKGWAVRGEGKTGSHGFLAIGSSSRGTLVPGKASVRLSANVVKSDGYIRNAATGKKLGGADDRNVRLTLDAAPADHVDLRVTIDHQKDVSAQLDTVRRNSYDITVPGDPGEQRKSSGLLGRVTWYGDDVELVSQTGWRSLDLDLRTRAVYPAFNMKLVNDVLSDESYLFQEFRVIGPDNDSALKWQAGIYLSDETFRVNQKIATRIKMGPVTLSNKEQFDHKQDTQRYEGFGQVDYEPFDDLVLTAGGRLSAVTRDATQKYRSALLPARAFDGAATRHFYNAVGRLAASYALTPEATAYASFSQGFKAGTARSGAMDNKSLFLPSERSNTFEVGFKGQALDTVLDLSLFHTGYKNRHTFFNTGAGHNAVIAIPKAKAMGVELGLDHELRDGWTLFGRVGYLHTKFDDLTLKSAQGGTFAIGGNRFRAAPSWTLAAGSHFETDIGNGWTLFANGDISYRSSHFGNIANTPASRNKGYTVVNAGLGVRKNGVTVGVTARNLLDRYYFASTTQADGRGHPGAPRSIFLNVSLQFDPE